MPSKFLRTWLNERSGIKGTVLYTIFAALYMAYQTLRCDWQFGALTYSTYNTVRTKLDLPAYDKRTMVSQLVDFLNSDFDQLTTELDKSCLDCEIALTDVDGDLQDMDMKQFVCGDFASTVGTSEYPPRDCATVDADYAAQPSAQKAPCCLNQTLVQASMSVMVWAHVQPQFLEPDFLSPGPLSLLDLLTVDSMIYEGGPDFGMPSLPQWKKDLFARTASLLPSPVASAGAYLYLRRSVDEGFVVQVIISRHQRMLGIECRAKWLDKVNEPDAVVSSQTFWTQNFRAIHDGLQFLIWLFWCWSFLHEILGFYSRNLTPHALFEELSQVYTIFFAFTTISPVIAELTKAGLNLTQWTLWISVNEAAIGLRCFDEGQHMMVGLKIVVQTMKTAFYSLGSLIFLTFFMSLVVGFIYGQLFGVVDNTLEPFTWGLARNMQQLVAPAELQLAHMVQNRGGALFFYYLCLFMFRLAFGSFVVAVLVAAFNKTRGEIDQHEKEKASCEIGFERRGHSVVIHDTMFYTAKQKFWVSLGIVWYLLTWRDYGTFVPTMERHLLRLSKAMGDDSGMRTMFSEQQLAEEFGSKTAMYLINDFAVAKTTMATPKEGPTSKDEALRDSTNAIKRINI